jgi:CTP synthase
MKKPKQTKYIFVTGGVVSGLGKGITAASLAKLLKARGFSVSMQKCDQYLNVDAGTLNPAEHGEVFVTADGAETDLDLGHYERFTGIEMSKLSSMMSGAVYSKVFADERAGKFLGKTVQMIPHITGEIQSQIESAGEGSDIHFVEIGGSIGDYEAMAFVEAIRQFKRRVGAENTLYVHVVFAPYLVASNELKTKPAQNSVRELRGLGIMADVLCVRSDHEIGAEEKEKLSLYCDVVPEAIVPLVTAKSVYQVPLTMEECGIGNYIVGKLGLPKQKADLDSWRAMVQRIQNTQSSVKIGVVAKYLSNLDTYASVFEALKAAGWHHGHKVEIEWINAEELEVDQAPLRSVDGILVPGGFGSRGVEGKILAARYARENKVPYLGLCLGMQVAVIEFARNVLGLESAHSTEMDANTKHPVIDIMHDQVGVKLGGTMRLGNYEAVINTRSRSYLAYGKAKVHERHRHRYEFNNSYRKRLEAAGMVVAAESPDRNLVEVIEIKGHPFFIASQAHPEFKSRPDSPHPLFRDFVAAVWKQSTSQESAQGSMMRAVSQEGHETA